MSGDVVSSLLQWLNANPELAGLATFVISAGESVAVIGTIVPGTVTMTAIGTLAGAGVIPLWGTIIWAILGAIVGDGISYWMGFYLKGRIHTIWPFKNNPSVLLKGETFVHKYGIMSVFIGRFVGPVRALVPLVAGALGMRPLHFTIANVTSAILWAPAYMLPGIMLGAASTELPPDIALHVILALLMVGLAIILLAWSLIKVLFFLHDSTNKIQDRIWRRLQGSRYAAVLTVALEHHDPHKTHGQLTLAFYSIITFILLLALACYVGSHTPSTMFSNDVAFHFFRGIRSPIADQVMIYITLLGQKQVIVPTILIVLAWMASKKHWRDCIHLAAFIGLAVVFGWAMKHLVGSARPWGIFASPDSFSFPSGHTTLATTFFFGLGYFLSRTWQGYYQRWVIFTTCALLSLAVATSRLYLGVHWLTDIVGAWLLSATLLFAVIISYQRHRTHPTNALGIIVITWLAFIPIANYYAKAHYEKMATDFAQISYPVEDISAKDWWAKNQMIPYYHVSLFGFPSQKINIEWAGDLRQIRKALIAQGWSKPPARDFVSTLHRISGVSSTEYLPMISPQYLDKKPEIIYTRRVEGTNQLYVLRLWEANRRLTGTRHPLWVGVVGLIPKTYSWLYRKHAGALSLINANLVFPNGGDKNKWQFKILNVDTSTKKHQSNQNILLIKPKTVN